MNLLREYIRQLLKEDLEAFSRDLSSARAKFRKSAPSFDGYHLRAFDDVIENPGGRSIKQVFNTHADHKWLATLDTVHSTLIGGLQDMINADGRDEISTVMYLPTEKIVPWGGNVGLWVKGRITLASNDMDKLYTGHYDEYMGPNAWGTPEEQGQRKKSSGVNKTPQTASAFDEEHYVLDKSTWKPADASNEALVDNWKPIGIIATYNQQKVLRDIARGRVSLDEIDNETKELIDIATQAGLPIFNGDRKVLWDPK